MKRFLVGVDGSPESGLATKKALELAKALGARLLLAHVSCRETGPAASYAMAAGIGDMVERDYAPALLAQAERDCRAEGVQADTSSGEGPVADTLASIAERENVEMVIVGHRSRGTVARTLMGSVADRLLQVAHCPVLVVR
jgi:nucleotide-binding universal stress UspA family protein